MRDKPMKDALITVRLPSAVKEALQTAADKDMRSLASMTAKILTDFVREQGLLHEGKPPSTRGGR